MAERKSRTVCSEKPQYKPTARDAAAFLKFRDARAERAPRLKAAKSKNVTKLEPDHPNGTIGTMLLMKALGTTDPDFFNGLVAQLADASGGEVREEPLNFMLSVIKGIKPQDQIETMLVAQMAAVHMAAMKASRSLAEANDLEHRDSADRMFNKLMRTFVTQMEALKRYRTGGQQTVTVQHVNVSEGGQAIVGNVTQDQRNASEKATAQPLAVTHDIAPPMPIIERRTAAPIPPPRNSKKK